MERNEFGKLVKGMKAVYPQPTFIPDQDAFDVWFSMLQDIPYKVASISTQQYIMLNKFPPTIADIRQIAADMTTEKLENESESWDLVYKAIRNSIYNCTAEFEKLPPTVQKVVGTPEQLRAWAMDSEFNAGVESSNFKRVYNQVKERKKNNAQLPSRLKILMDELQDNRQQIGMEE